MSGVAPRWDIASAEALQALLVDPLLPGLRAGPARRSFLRDLYFDTPAGDLRRRDIACRVRFAADDRRTLVLEGLRPGAAPGGRSASRIWERRWQSAMASVRSWETGARARTSCSLRSRRKSLPARCKASAKWQSSP